jgi:hypothetical protein
MSGSSVAVKTLLFINDTVFSQPISREKCFVSPTGAELSEEATQWVELFCYDADLNNNSLDGVMEQIADMSSIFGHCFVAVDMTSEDQGTAGRPYVSVISPMQVWDYTWQPVRGRFMLNYVKVLERSDDRYYYFKEYTLGTVSKASSWSSYRVNKEKPSADQAELLDSGTFPVGMSLPIFLSYTRRDPRTIDVGISDIDAATDVQRECYATEAEAYSSILFAKTLIRAEAGIKVPATAGGIVRASEGQVETLTVDTSDVSSIIQKQEQLLMGLENLTGLGGLRQNRAEAQSGVSIIQERKTLHKMAGQKARMLEITEEMIFTFAARWMDCRWAGEVLYGTDYDAEDIKYKVALLSEVKKISPDNPVIQGMIDHEIVELLSDDPEEVEQAMELMRATNPSMVEPIEEAEEPAESADMGDQRPQELEQKTSVMMPQGGASRYVGQTTYDPTATALLEISRQGPI